MDAPTVDEQVTTLQAEFPDWSICWDDCRQTGRAMRLGGWKEYRGEHGQLLPLWLENTDLVWLRRDLRSWEDMWARQCVRWAQAD